MSSKQDSTNNSLINDKKLISLELQIQIMEEAIQSLKDKHVENNLVIEALLPKIGKKRKHWQAI
jgi:hypothetical protein